MLVAVATLKKIINVSSRSSNRKHLIFNHVGSVLLLPFSWSRGTNAFRFQMRSKVTVMQLTRAAVLLKKALSGLYHFFF